MYSKTEQTVLSLSEPIAGKMGCFIYDVEYKKEGQERYLRVFADKDGGITLDECEAISRELSNALDESDPISENYFLEVSSPGIERKLTKPKHFEMYIGSLVDVGLYKAIDGAKTLCGVLLNFENDEITLGAGDEEIKIKLSDTSSVRLHFEF